MFLRLVMKSLWVRRDRFLVAGVAVMLAAAMVASLLTISLDIRGKMGKELRSYGANLIVLPGEGEYISQFEPEDPSIIGFAPYLYFKAEANAKKIDFAGTDLEATAKMNPWWRIEGILPKGEEVLLGVNAAKKLGAKIGDTLTIEGKSLKVSGILDTGTSDDDRVFMPMETAEEIIGKRGASLVKVSALGDIEGVIKYLEGKNYKVKKIMQVAESEKNLLDKTQLLMVLVSIFVLSAAGLGLMSTMITCVLERSREIGLMKALGCGNLRLAAIFLAEAGVVGFVGGVFGYFTGIMLARFIGLEIFAIGISAKPEVLVLTLVTSILIAFLGSLLPVKRAISVDPVIILRSE